MSNPDWRTLELAPGVVREPTPEATRLVLWLPEPAEAGAGRWQRISSGRSDPFHPEQGLCAVSGTSISIRVLQPPHGLMGRLFLHFRKPTDTVTWHLPNGRVAEQVGERQTDLLLVWSDNASRLVDETRIKTCWPHSSRVQRLGNNLFLV